MRIVVQHTNDVYAQILRLVSHNGGRMKRHVVGLLDFHDFGKNWKENERTIFDPYFNKFNVSLASFVSEIPVMSERCEDRKKRITNLQSNSLFAAQRVIERCKLPQIKHLREWNAHKNQFDDLKTALCLTEILQSGSAMPFWITSNINFSIRVWSRLYAMPNDVFNLFIKSAMA